MCLLCYIHYQFLFFQSSHHYIKPLFLEELQLNESFAAIDWWNLNLRQKWFTLPDSGFLAYLVGEMRTFAGYYFMAGFGDEDVVFEPHAELAGDIYAGLNC